MSDKNGSLLNALGQTASESTAWGGNWLRAARVWIQNNFTNGSNVTWGSDERLSYGITATPPGDAMFTIQANEHLKWVLSNTDETLRRWRQS